jgi:seryl-tRNA synthetase
LLLPSGIDGIYARTAAFEDVIGGLTAVISRLREPDTEVLRFPPVMSRRQVEMSGFLNGAPDLLGCVCCLERSGTEGQGAIGRHAGHWTAGLSATDLVLTPSACYPVYPLVASRSDVPAGGLLFDTAAECFRREPSGDLDRLQSFRMREFVCIGTVGQVDDFRRRWMTRAAAVAEQLGLPYRFEPADDPLFSSQDASKLARGAPKFKLLVPIRSAEQPTVCVSFNDHRDHFGFVWNLRNASGQTMSTGCIAFGMERLALAMFSTHGLDLAVWPSDVRQVLAM